MEEAETSRPRLTMFTDRSRLDSGACGYASGGGPEGPHGLQPGTVRREVRGHRPRAQDRSTPSPPTAQVAIKRMQTLMVGPGQTHAIAARWVLAETGCPVEIRWCTAYKGVQGDGKAGEWAKPAADEPDDHGVEWSTPDNRPRPMPRPASLRTCRDESR